MGRGGRMRSAPPAAEAVDASAGHPPARRRRRTVSPAWGALAPLTVVIIAFFVIPICGMVTTSVLVPGPERGSSVLSAENFAALGSGSRSMALQNSLLLSFTAATVAAVFGGVCAWAISTVKSKIIDSLTAVISSVLANDGGVPLAFSFIVAVGNTGYFTALVTAVDSTFTLYSVKGLILMYQYFLIPTMILLTLPSFVALRQQWREANTSLGGPSLTFWRRVGLPVITPALRGRSGNTGYFTALVTAVYSTFTLYSVKGLILMYQYFLIPTMILLTLPSFVALRQQWREANTSLGGTSLTFWRRVGLPVITPALLG